MDEPQGVRDPRGSGSEPVPLETLLLPSDAAEPLLADDPPEFAGVVLPPIRATAAAPPPRVPAPSPAEAAPGPARPAAPSVLASVPGFRPRGDANSPTTVRPVVGALLVAALVAVFAAVGYLRTARVEAPAPPTRLPATLADAATPPAPAEPPVRSAAAPERLYGGRTAGWWRERLALLASRTDSEGARLHAVTLHRAARLGVTVAGDPGAPHAEVTAPAASGTP